MIRNSSPSPTISKLILVICLLVPIFGSMDGFAASNACQVLFGSGSAVDVSQSAHLELQGVSENGDEQLILHTRRGASVAIRRRGRADASSQVLFLNGIDRDMSQWSKLIDQLSSRDANAAYLQVDLLGQGQTAKWAGSPKQALPYELQIELLEDLSQASKLSPDQSLTIVGHSYGGGIAVKFAQLHPRLVRRLVLIAPYVDNLEHYQIGAGPILMWTKTWFEMFGAEKMYRDYFHLANESWMKASWSTYRAMKGSSANLDDVIALTRGIEDLGMTQAVVGLTDVKVDMVVASFDEVIPMAAHLLLFNHIPQDSRGSFKVLMSTHEIVDSSVGPLADVIHPLSR